MLKALKQLFLAVPLCIVLFLLAGCESSVKTVSRTTDQAKLAKIALEDPHQFSSALESLFRTMAKGGMFGQHKIRHFNGHLFEDTTVFELNDDERRVQPEREHGRS